MKKFHKKRKNIHFFYILYNLLPTHIFSTSCPDNSCGKYSIL